MPNFCAECGSRLQPQAKYCSDCGHAVPSLPPPPSAPLRPRTLQTPSTSSTPSTPSAATCTGREERTTSRTSTPQYKQASLFDAGVVTQVSHRGTLVAINRSLTTAATNGPVSLKRCPHTDCTFTTVRGCALTSHKQTCKHRFKHKHGQAVQTALSRQLFCNRVLVFSFRPTDVLAQRCFYAGGMSCLWPEGVVREVAAAACRQMFDTIASAVVSAFTTVLPRI